ncbi:L-type lectin-domain containing receptor kinase IX.2-like [Triticum urartu]|nr:L-type lectin-domain containing receptor kinase IX.2-like [Triticum urartu]
MAFQLNQLVPCLCIIILLSIISFSHAKVKEMPCIVRDSDEDQGRNYTLDDPDLVFLVDKDSGFAQMHLYNLSYAALNNTVLSTMDRLIELYQKRPDGLGVDEASFSVTIVVRNQTTSAASNHLAFLILPAETLDFLQVNDSLPLAKELVFDTSFYPQANRSGFANTTYRSGSVYGVDMYVDMTIGMLASPTQTGYVGERVLVVNIFTSIVGPNYSVWIDYDHVGLLSVYADAEGKPKPSNAIGMAPFSIGSVISPTSPFAYFGFLSTVESRLRIRGIRFTATVDNFPCYPVKRGFLSRKVTILSSVLGSIAATAVVAATLACYFNSRYRRWHKDLDQLARSMERLPGVPTKIDFIDIRKATNNFHDGMKLGGGGFGTVYRCTLPASASKLERPMDVAIKRFTRDVQNRRYDDFLTEVSIINRLRHKNIVPLIGWSYNKGVPLLVFEFMNNGSLDQHIFHRGGSGTKQQNIDDAIRRWATRYEIIMGIATALHYVHHEYEPMVLHRDIKASNIMLDSRFQACLGDFGLACTVAIDRNSVTGVGGTWGYIAPEYPVCRKATRQTDIYALGVLILEVVTGLRALADHEVVDDDDMHITDRVWRLHREGRLLECVDAMLISGFSPDNEEQLDNVGDAERLLLLGLACSNPNPSDRPTMREVVQVIAKLAPPPQVSPLKPRFVWPPQEEGHSVTCNDDSLGTSMVSNLDKSMASLTRGRA